MLKLNEFRHNHHPSGVKMLAKFIRRGFSVIVSLTSHKRLCNIIIFIMLKIFKKQLRGDNTSIPKEFRFSSDFIAPREIWGIYEWIIRPDLPKKLTKAMSYFWEISGQRIRKKYKVDKFPSTVEDIREKKDKEGRIPIFVPHEINLIDLGRIFAFLGSRYAGSKGVADYGSKYIAEGSPVVDTVNNFGWLWVEGSNLAPNRGASPKELEDMFRLQGRQGQSLRTYIVGGLITKFFMGNFFDTQPIFEERGSRKTSSILLGSSIEGSFIHAEFSTFSIDRALIASPIGSLYSNRDVGGRSEEVITRLKNK